MVRVFYLALLCIALVAQISGHSLSSSRASDVVAEFYSKKGVENVNNIVESNKTRDFKSDIIDISSESLGHNSTFINYTSSDEIKKEVYQNKQAIAHDLSLLLIQYKNDPRATNILQLLGLSPKPDVQKDKSFGAKILEQFPVVHEEELYVMTVPKDVEVDHKDNSNVSDSKNDDDIAQKAKLIIAEILDVQNGDPNVHKVPEEMDEKCMLKNVEEEAHKDNEIIDFYRFFKINRGSAILLAFGDNRRLSAYGR